MEESLIRYIHFIGIIILSSALVAEHLLYKKEMGREAFRQFVNVDRIYGIGAGITLLGGLLLIFYTGKPAEFYSSNPIFHIKMTLFVLVAALSFIPTRFLLVKSRTDEGTIVFPKYMIGIIRAELCFLLVMPLLAALMAQGIGYS